MLTTKLTRAPLVCLLGKKDQDFLAGDTATLQETDNASRRHHHGRRNFRLINGDASTALARKDYDSAIWKSVSEQEGYNCLRVSFAALGLGKSPSPIRKLRASRIRVIQLTLLPHTAAHVLFLSLQPELSMLQIGWERINVRLRARLSFSVLDAYCPV